MNETIQEIVRETLHKLSLVYQLVDDYPHAQAQEKARFDIMLSSLTTVYEKGLKDGKAYLGEQKRIAYQQGIEEGQKEPATEVAYRLGYQTGKADRDEEVLKKCEELMFINKSGHPLHHGYYQSALDDLRNFLSS